MTASLRDFLKSTARTFVRAGNHGGGRVAVLCYHSVHPSSPVASVSSREFREQIAWLSSNCDMVPLSKVPDLARSSGRDRPAVAVTFDDAFEDNFEYAWPVLEEFGCPATLFVATGLVEKQPPVVRRFARLLGVPDSAIKPLRWEHIREMHTSGMEIGAHTVTHPNLSVIPPAAARWEIETSKRVLEDVIGEELSAFAYPFGKPKHNFNAHTRDLVRDAGFSIAGAIHCRTVRPGDHPLSVPRIPIGSGGTSAVESAVSGDDDLLGIWQESAPRWLSHVVSPERSHTDELSLGAPDPSG